MDLCYNCHQIHLPRACQKPLQECTTCHTLGHSWNFCHLGAPNYRYFGLCHNCQKWHLPQPCPEQPSFCEGCKQYGHQRDYCPVSPTLSPVFMASMSDTISYGLTTNSVQWILHSSVVADEIYNIKMGAVMDALQLFAGGRTGENVRRCLANAYRGTPQPFDAPPTPASVMPRTSNAQNSALLLPHPNIPPQNHADATPFSEHGAVQHKLAPLQHQNVYTQQSNGTPKYETDHTQTQDYDQSGKSTAGSAYRTENPASAVVAQDNHDPLLNLAQFHTYDNVFDEASRSYCSPQDGSQKANTPGDSSGQGSFSMSSPCGAHINSANRKGKERIASS